MAKSLSLFAVAASPPPPQPLPPPTDDHIFRQPYPRRSAASESSGGLDLRPSNVSASSTRSSGKIKFLIGIFLRLPEGRTTSAKLIINLTFFSWILSTLLFPRAAPALHVLCRRRRRRLLLAVGPRRRWLRAGVLEQRDEQELQQQREQQQQRMEVSARLGYTSYFPPARVAFSAPPPSRAFPDRLWRCSCTSS